MKRVGLTSVVCAVLGLGFLGMYLAERNRYSDHPWIPIAHRVRSQVVRRLAQKYDLAPFGCGGALMSGVDQISIHFKASGEMERDEARKLIVSCAQDFLAIIDASDEIQPYLKRSPCPIGVVDLTIYFVQPDHRPSLIPFVSVVGLYGGAVLYFFDDETSLSGTYKYVEEERYEEALATLNRVGQAGG